MITVVQRPVEASVKLTYLTQADWNYLIVILNTFLNTTISSDGGEGAREMARRILREMGGGR